MRNPITVLEEVAGKIDVRAQEYERRYNYAFCDGLRIAAEMVREHAAALAGAMATEEAQAWAAVVAEAKASEPKPEAGV